MRPNPDPAADHASAWLSGLGYHVERVPEGVTKTCDLVADHPTGRLWVECKEDHAMSPGSVQQTLASGERRRIPYYISQKAIKQGYKRCAIKSINARHMDDLVRGLVLDHLRRSHPRIDPAGHTPAERDQRVRDLIRRVVVTAEALTVEVAAGDIARSWGPVGAPGRRDRGGDNQPPSPSCPFTPTVTAAGGVEVLTLPIRIKCHDGRRILVSPEGHDLTVHTDDDGRRVPRPNLVAAVGRAFALHRELVRTRGTIQRVAARFGITEAWARALLDLTTLSPSILKAVLTGTLPATVTLQDLRNAAEHLDWSLQEAALKV